MRILIVGSGGRLGRLLYAANKVAAQPGVEVIFQSRQSGRDVQWSPSDPLENLPRCDALVALWGITSGPDEALAQNSELVALTQAVAQNCDARLVFHLSSAAIYGPGQKMKEDAPQRPQSPYGSAKQKMEQSVKHLEGEPAHKILRLANVIGADSLTPALRSDDDALLDQFSDGHGPLRSYVGARDLLAVIEALSKIPSSDLPCALNVAAGAPIYMEDILQAAGKTIRWRPAPPTAIQEVSLDVSCLQALIPELPLMSKPEDLVQQLSQLEMLT